MKLATPPGGLRASGGGTPGDAGSAGSLGIGSGGHRASPASDRNRLARDRSERLALRRVLPFVEGTAIFAVARMSAGTSTGELWKSDVIPRRGPAARSRFLISASAALSESLDYEPDAAAGGGLSVPDIADWCTVTVVDELGEARRLAVVHADPARRELATPNTKRSSLPTEHRMTSWSTCSRGRRRPSACAHHRPGSPCAPPRPRITCACFRGLGNNTSYVMVQSRWCGARSWA